MTLRRQILIIFLCISLIPAILLFSSLYLLSSTKMDSAQKDILKGYSNVVSQHIESSLSETENLMYTLSLDPYLILSLYDYKSNHIITDHEKFQTIGTTIQSVLKKDSSRYLAMYLGYESFARIGILLLHPSSFGIKIS